MLPSFTLPVSLHSETPVEHSVTPVLQRLLLGKQGSFALHGAHEPALQTRSVPHSVPSALFWVRLQVLAAPEQDNVPVLQPTRHSLPSMQSVHAPLAQTLASLFSHLLPLLALPTASHTFEPLAHENFPALQTVPGGVQSPPATQSLHTPALHTFPAPQTSKPSATALPVSVHVRSPVQV